MENKKLTKAEAKKLLAIAKKHSYSIEQRGDLEQRRNDEEDFIEMAVWNIEAMLEEAYRLGQASK